MTEDLSRQGDDPVTRARLIRGLRRLTQSMQRMVDLLPRHLVGLPCEPQLLDIGREIERFVDSTGLADDQRIALAMELTDGVTVEVDPAFLERVLGNLLRNAMQAIDGQGTVLVAARPGDAAALARLTPDAWTGESPVWQTVASLAGPIHWRTGVAAAAGGAWCAIAIIDTGRGMSADFVEQELFQPFASPRRGGLGIGMYAAFELVRRMGGDLVVHSRPDTGTACLVFLPLASTTH